VENIHEYIAKLSTQYKTGIAREHAYRGYLQTLLEELAPGILATNEPARVACGAPDYILTRTNIPIGYIEAKDIGKALDAKEYKEQFDRYKGSLNNLIITDYLDFWLYRDGELVSKTRIGEIAGKNIRATEEHFKEFSNLIAEFTSYGGQTITTAPKLSRMMAGKARLLAKVIEAALTSDERGEADSTLREQMEAFRKILLHDINPKQFADIYAQTIAYGMFAARLHDKTLENFSRQEAAELIPKSNPFLRNLFGYIAGPNLDDRIRWIVDALADIFRATDVSKLVKSIGASTKKNDPLIHFYETFLAEYDPALRKSRGVWYTPEAVVGFIVRAVDSILRDDFNISDGLADNGKTSISIQSQTRDRRSKSGYKSVEKEVHRVQILDPAAGTGTFLAEVIKNIYAKFAGKEGIWSSYVDNDLIPRLNGFELLMAPYSVAHLKLELLLAETGYIKTKEQRFRVFLTNTLEEHHPDTGTLFASWLSREASDANHIKRDTPVMIVLGNPPYAVSSSNKGEWITDLLKTYKKNLGERKLNLDDDYIKFIRYGQYLVEKNGEGVLAYISNNSFIDGITHRQMRKSLLKSFDKIYILDLHGNAKKQEVAPDGGKDENVFDIQQGVSINIFVKTTKRSGSASVYHHSLYGKRQDKYESLFTEEISSINWQKIPAVEPYYFFIPKDFSNKEEYEKGFSLSELMPENNTGIQTKRDKFVYCFTQDELKQRLEDLRTKNTEEIRREYNLPADGRDWAVKWAAEDLENNVGQIVEVDYHPFDARYTYFTGKSKGFMAYPRAPLSLQTLEDNVMLLAVRNSRRGNVNSYFVSKRLVDKDAISPFDNCKFFPLYIYGTDAQVDALAESTDRTPNLSPTIIQEIASCIGLSFAPEECDGDSIFTPIDVFDYVYAVLYSNTYREMFEEHLKIDFPRIPYPQNTERFLSLVELGKKLRKLHLMEDLDDGSSVTYPAHGDNTVTRRIVGSDFELTDEAAGVGRVWINDAQFFDGMSEETWTSEIGGFKPAQKWLKDRKGRELSFDEIDHYQKILFVLERTNDIMAVIDEVYDGQ